MASDELSMKQLGPECVRKLQATLTISAPCDVVKELIENSLDAKATSIEVRLADSGLEKISVRDNGQGVKHVDAIVMARPHFTSKLRDYWDLQHLTTFGFRGMALAAVAALSSLTIETRTKADTRCGRRYTYNADGICRPSPSGPEAVAMTSGTAVHALKVFQNIPVRRKMFEEEKRKEAQLASIKRVVHAAAIANPQVAFSLSHNKDCLWRKPPFKENESLMVFSLLYPHDTFKHLRTVRKAYDRREMTVILSCVLPEVNEGMNAGAVTRSSNSGFWIFANSRPVKVPEIEKMVVRYVTQALKLDGTRRKWPIGMVSIRAHPSQIDFTVEPDKSGVFVAMAPVLQTLESILVDLYGGQEAADQAVGPPVTTAAKPPVVCGLEEPSLGGIVVSGCEEGGSIASQPVGQAHVLPASSTSSSVSVQGLSTSKRPSAKRNKPGQTLMQRPPCAAGLFEQELRLQMKGESGVDRRAVKALARQKWKLLDEKTKEGYEEKSRALLKKYNERMAEHYLALDVSITAHPVPARDCSGQSGATTLKAGDLPVRREELEKPAEAELELPPIIFQDEEIGSGSFSIVGPLSDDGFWLLKFSGDGKSAFYLLNRLRLAEWTLVQKWRSSLDLEPEIQPLAKLLLLPPERLAGTAWQALERLCGSSPCRQQKDVDVAISYGHFLRNGIRASVSHMGLRITATAVHKTHYELEDDVKELLGMLWDDSSLPLSLSRPSHVMKELYARAKEEVEVESFGTRLSKEELYDALYHVSLQEGMLTTADSPSGSRCLIRVNFEGIDMTDEESEPLSGHLGPMARLGSTSSLGTNPTSSVILRLKPLVSEKLPQNLDIRSICSPNALLCPSEPVTSPYFPSCLQTDLSSCGEQSIPGC